MHGRIQWYEPIFNAISFDKNGAQRKHRDWDAERRELKPPATARPCLRLAARAQDCNRKHAAQRHCDRPHVEEAIGRLSEQPEKVRPLRHQPPSDNGCLSRKKSEAKPAQNAGKHEAAVSDARSKRTTVKR